MAFRVFGDPSREHDLVDQAERQALRRAIIVSRHICFSDFGMRCSNVAYASRDDHPRPIGTPLPPGRALDISDAHLDEIVLARQRAWRDGDNMEVVLDANLPDYVEVLPVEPKVLRLRRSVREVCTVYVKG